MRACLEEAVRRDPGYAGAWAMLAFAHLDAARYGLVEPAARPGELDAGLAAAQRAVELAPESVRSLQSLAALHFARGEYDEAERVQRQAIALNPHDPESLAQLGWRLMVRGQWEEGGTLLQEAVDRSMVVPAWYHETLAVALYLGGDLQRARDEAELGKAIAVPVMPSWRSPRPPSATPPRPVPRWTRPSANHRSSPATRSPTGPTSKSPPRSSSGSTRAWSRQVCNCRLLPVTSSHVTSDATPTVAASPWLREPSANAEGSWPEGAFRLHLTTRSLSPRHCHPLCPTAHPMVPPP